MLAACFAYLHIPKLRDVPIALLHAHKSIPDRYLIALAEAPSVFDLCTIETRRQVWRYNIKLFKNSLLPLLRQYASTFDSMQETMDADTLRRVGSQSRWQQAVGCEGEYENINDGELVM